MLRMLPSSTEILHLAYHAGRRGSAGIRGNTKAHSTLNVFQYVVRFSASCISVLSVRFFHIHRAIMFSYGKFLFFAGEIFRGLSPFYFSEGFNTRFDVTQKQDCFDGRFVWKRARFDLGSSE